MAKASTPRRTASKIEVRGRRQRRTKLRRTRKPGDRMLSAGRGRGDCCPCHVVGPRSGGHRRSGNGCDTRCLSIGGRRPSSSRSIFRVYRIRQKGGAGMSNVIKFPSGVSRRSHARKGQAMPATGIIHDDRPKAGSATAGNGRLRKERHEVWRKAEAATRYWRLRMEFQSAVSWTQRMGTPEGRFIPVTQRTATARHWSKAGARHCFSLPRRMLRRSNGSKRR